MNFEPHMVTDAFRDLVAQLNTDEREAINTMMARAHHAGTKEAEATARDKAAEAASGTRTKADAYERGYKAGAASNATAAAQGHVLAGRVTDFVLAAVTAERERWTAALSAPEAEGRSAFVVKMLTRTDLAPEAIVELAADVAPVASDHGFSAVMSKFTHGAKPEMSDAPSTEADAKEARKAELQAAGKAVGRVSLPI